MYKIQTSYWLLIALVTLACSSDDNVENVANYEVTYATSVETSSEVFIGETINILVYFRVTNGCGEFKRFVENGNGLTRIIEIEAKYEGIICTQDLPLRNATYKFTPNSPGEYIFNFKSGPDLRFENPGPDEFITVKVLVKEK